MIAVTREAEPDFLDSNWEEETRRFCERHRQHHLTPRKTAPKAYGAIYRHPDVLAALERSFQKRCAYCESVLPGKLDVEHFRPEAIYPALAYRWSNLLLACNFCNSHHKGAQFPLLPDGAQPTFDPANPDALDDSDAAMLVDPCRDDPREHFDWDGEVLTCKTERAEKTREVCGLDRGDLIERLRSHIDKIQAALDGWELAQLLPDVQQETDWRADLWRYCGWTPVSETGRSEPYISMAQVYVSVKLNAQYSELREEFVRWKERQ